MTPSSFADPYWWTDDPTQIADDQVLQDFYTYLGKQLFEFKELYECIIDTSELPDNLKQIHTAFVQQKEGKVQGHDITKLAQFSKEEVEAYFMYLGKHIPKRVSLK